MNTLVAFSIALSNQTVLVLPQAAGGPQLSKSFFVTAFRRTEQRQATSACGSFGDTAVRCGPLLLESPQRVSFVGALHRQDAVYGKRVPGGNARLHS